MSNAKRHRVDVWLPPEDLERARGMALARGFSRKVPGEERRTGDLAGYIRAWMQKQNEDPQRRARLYGRLRESGRELAAPHPSTPAVRWEFRVTHGDLEAFEKAANFAGFRQGGRGNVSAFMRAIVRMACTLPQEQPAEMARQASA